MRNTGIELLYNCSSPPPDVPKNHPCHEHLKSLSLVVMFPYYCLVPTRKQLSPDQFSRHTVEELGLSRTFIQPVAESIRRQLLNYARKLPGLATEGTIAPSSENIQPLEIDVRYRSVIYRDRLQWDVNSLHGSPEIFARHTVADLALPQVLMISTVNFVGVKGVAYFRRAPGALVKADRSESVGQGMSSRKLWYECHFCFSSYSKVDWDVWVTAGMVKMCDRVLEYS